MDEALLIDVLALPEYRERLVAEDASTEEWAKYRAFRCRVLAAAGIPVAA